MEWEEEQERKRGHRWVWWLAAVLLALIAAGAALLFWGNQFSLELILQGEQEIFLEYGHSYEEPGAQPVFFGSKVLRGGITPEVEVKTHSGINPNLLGRYTVTYSADFYGYRASAERVVWIVDTVCPVIELVPGPQEPPKPGERYKEDGYRAVDNYDGDITDRVVRTELEGKILYAVADSSGNPCCVERLIPGYDPLGPQITLEGEAKILLPAGTVYEEPGYHALDNLDGDLTDQVEVEGEVLWYKPGTYTIFYTATDSSGNISTVVRCVEVVGQPRIEPVEPEGKVIYLTFDDGPGPYTLQLLDILDEYNVKATFFVVDNGYDEVMQEIVRRGHSIGIHTMSHAYNDIYSSPEAYFADLYGMQRRIEDVTGTHTTLMRFPGGGSNTISCPNPGIMTLLTEAVQDAGFQYFDWNVDSNDAGGAKSADTVRGNILDGILGNRISVVLQHDIHPYSVEAVEDVIRWGMENGYTFLPLTADSPTCHHGVRN